jgi:RHH-type proline utilization regulon transcriptional repressor/proline dehydrogenase/delta 1-pyrroline-5-carboxylate dehydrogenase
LKKGLTQLEPGEEWLLEPRMDPDNPNLWSPGIKLGVSPKSFTHTAELFGPVLGVMKARELKEAIEFANGTPYGLTSGIQSLDQREINTWLANIEAGNLYVNRGITGAIVQRQPFGGFKGSGFGRGAKAGGPNYLTQLMRIEQISYPEQQNALSSPLSALSIAVTKNLRGQQLQLWNGSLGSYAYYWNHYFSKKHDPSNVLGQYNELYYVPQKKMYLRVQDKDTDLDILRVMAAASICGTPLEVSYNPGRLQFPASYPLQQLKLVTQIEESEEQFFARISQTSYARIRLLSQPSEFLENGLANLGIVPLRSPLLANGRLELLNYLREVSLSQDYHRYGYITESLLASRGKSNCEHYGNKQIARIKS